MNNKQKKILMGEQFIIFHPSSWLATPRKGKPSPERFLNIRCIKLRPDYSCSYSGSGLWLVRMWSGPRAPIQAAQVTQATDLCGSDICRYITETIEILWTIKLILVMKT